MWPHTHRLLFHGIFVLVVLLMTNVLTSLPCHADCPTNTILGATSVFAHEMKTSGASYVGGETAEYDLVAGKMTGSYWAIVDASVSLLSLADNYTLEGLPAGTPVSIVIELDVQASASGSGRYGISLQGPDGIIVSHGGDLGWSGTVHVTEAVSAGQPFEVHFHMGASSLTNGIMSKASAAATLHFSNLPQGTSIVSCQGFRQDAVPVHPQSWGSVKAFYR